MTLTAIFSLITVVMIIFNILFQQITLSNMRKRLNVQSETISKQTEVIVSQQNRLNSLQENVTTAFYILEQLTGKKLVKSEPQSDDWADVIEGEIIE